MSVRTVVVVGSVVIVIAFLKNTTLSLCVFVCVCLCVCVHASVFCMIIKKVIDLEKLEKIFRKTNLCVYK